MAFLPYRPHKCVSVNCSSYILRLYMFTLLEMIAPSFLLRQSYITTLHPEAGVGRAPRHIKSVLHYIRGLELYGCQSQFCLV